MVSPDHSHPGTATRTGRRIGVYEIQALLGAGGMGEVYRARDVTLGRDVAIKFLSRAFTGDPARLSRFEREARTLAALNHPHIGAIYGVEESDGARALVLELVEGATLAERVSSGPIPIAESLRIARQIADALDAAHERGIVHRDLKPANIGITPEGVVKVLDFGLATTAGHDRSAVELSQLPTETVGGTREGAILGTARYMSPEQARGQLVDKRADIWAFGCVLLEMLAGRPAFPAGTFSDTIAAVLTREPDWNGLPQAMRPGVRRLLEKCLEKDPRQRLRDIGDARIEIDEALASPLLARTGDTSIPARPVRMTWPMAIGAVVLLVATGAALSYWRARTVSPEAVRLSMSAPGPLGTQPPNVVMSPDGRRVALVAADASGKDMIWIRALDSQEAQVLPGTERADQPFWSPDNRALGFYADSQLKTVAAAGGPVQVLATAPVSPGATWNQDGIILFAQGGGLSTISVAGGAIAPALTPPAGTSVAWPHFLPDGRHFLYFARSAQGSGVWVGGLDTGETKRILDAEFEATYAPPGYLLFVREETLMAQPFDTKRLELTGAPAPVAAGVWVARGYGHGVFSAGANGALAYVSADIANTQLAWFDRGGRPLGTVGPPQRYDSPPQLSPTGAGIAMARGPFFRQDLWLRDLAHETDARFTFGPAGNRVPVWSPDGSRVFFQSSRGDGRARLYQKNSSGAGAEEQLADIAGVNLQDISPDGRFIVYMTIGKTGRFELWALPLAGNRQPFPLLQTASNNGQAQVSPDGRWIAYTSNESGRDEVYIQSFPAGGSKHQVSIDGGVQARWRRTGGELFYLAPDRALMAVPVKTSLPLQIDRPSALFRTQLEVLGLQGPLFMPGYDVAADGQRFLLNGPPEHIVPPIDILLNWTAVLNGR